MLVLSRRPGEDLIIADNILIRVLGINYSQVRLGIEAPRSIEVHRREIFERINICRMTPEEIAKYYPIVSNFK